MGHNFYVGSVGQMYFCMGQNFLCDSKMFAWVIFLGSFFYFTILKLIILDTFFTSPFPVNLDQTLFDLFSVFD